ncbi:MAG TPA: glycoside hydrolase family 2, partial [Lentisphaeria bacterium]|nr:glycoside hydrolase family 2 [Lentisphaeria bacterium]
MTDRSFRPNDMKQYAKYAAKPTSWGEPNGIGYSGTIGLAKALQPGSMDYAKEVYGKRLLELMRQDERIDGFAPWFHGYRLKAATLWNQPVLVGLRDEQSIMPRGLFSGRENDFTLYIADSTDRPVPAGTAELTCVTADGRELPAGTFPTPAAEPFR